MFEHVLMELAWSEDANISKKKGSNDLKMEKYPKVPVKWMGMRPTWWHSKLLTHIPTSGSWCGFTPIINEPFSHGDGFLPLIYGYLWYFKVFECIFYGFLWWSAECNLLGCFFCGFPKMFPTQKDVAKLHRSKNRLCGSFARADAADEFTQFDGHGTGHREFLFRDGLLSRKIATRTTTRSEQGSDTKGINGENWIMIYDGL